jgi:uncharacterized protein YkwD
MKNKKRHAKINFLGKLKDSEFIDSDADGLLDIEEKALGTDPFCTDTDKDGLGDFEEVYVYGTDPLSYDTDQDGMSDGDEVRLGYNPKGPGRLKDFFFASQSNNYKPQALHAKRIIFYILAALIVKAIVVVSLLSFPMDAWLTQDVALEQSKKIIALTNQIRTKLGLKTLAENQVLDQAAGIKAQDMLEKQYFAHVSPENRSLAYWLSIAKYAFFTAGENLAMGFSDANDVVNAWTQSKTHYANIIDPDFTQIGVGMVTGKYKGFDTTFVTQMFGTPKTVTQPKPKISSNPDTLVQRTTPKTLVAAKTVTTANPSLSTNYQTIKKTPTLIAKAPAQPTKKTAQIKNALVAKSASAQTPPPPPALPEPVIITPADKTLTKDSQSNIRIYAPLAEKVNLMMDGKVAANASRGSDQYFETSVFLENGIHVFKAIAYRSGQEKYSKEIIVTLDNAPPQIDLNRTSISINDNNGEQELVTVTAMLSADTVKAEASFNNYNIELKPDPDDLNRWSGQTLIFSEKGDENLNPVVPANITATDRAGSTVTQDIMWENMRPLRQSMVNQYLYLKNNQSSYTKLLFDISSTFYKILIILAMLILGVNIFLEIHKKHPHLIYSTIGLVVLLAILLIV